MTTVLTVRGPEDLLAAVPLVLGFHPQASLVMLTFGASDTFHARLDLPRPGDEQALAETVEALLGPSRAHEVDHVVFIVYADSPGLAAWLAAALVPAFVAEGIGVAGVLRAHGSHWSGVPLRDGAEETPPVRYGSAIHPFAARAVFDGLVTRATREELRDTLMRDADLHERWGVLLERLPADAGPAEEARARALVASWVGSGGEPDDDGATRVLQVLARVDVRDALLYSVTRGTARDHLRVWSSLLRGAPDHQVPDAAALTAFCAWLSGDGALAWCALDRCFEVEPEHALGTGLAECLTRAVPPSSWEGVVDEARSSASA
jgi:hypothetical protein